MAANPVQKKSPAEIQDELSFLRQKANSLAFRGQYAECAGVIEEKLSFFYINERWPENFLFILLLHRKCYSMMSRADVHDEFIRKQLERLNIPVLFVELMNSGGRDVKWDAVYFRDKTIELRLQKDYERALGYAEICLKIEPSSNSYLVLGLTLQDLGRHDDAISAFEHALEISPSNTNARHGLVKAYVERNPKKAIEFIQKAIEDAPNDPVLHAQKAVLLARAGRNDSAIEEWDAAATLDPLKADYPYEKAELLYAEGKGRDAVALYRRAVGLNEKHMPSRRRLAELLAEKSPAAALEFGQPVWAENPDDFDFGIIYADVLRRVGEAEEASKIYLRLIESNEKDHRCWAGLARIHRRTQPEKALEYIGRALALNPQQAAYNKENAEILEAANRPDEAVAAYRTAANLDKGDHEPQGALGRLLTESNPREALAFYEQALKLAPEKPVYYTGKALILQGMPGREDEALDVLETACKYDPGNALLHQSIAVWLERIYNRASALRHFEEAVSLDTNLHESYCGIARLIWDTRPHRALSAINLAINKKLAEASYFYWKARILARLSGDNYALANIERDDKNASQELLDEIDTLLSGNALRVALFYADRAVDHAPNNNIFLCLRAELLVEAGQDGKARERYESLLKKDPDNHAALYGLGKLVAKSKKEDKKALDYFERAIKLDVTDARYHAAKAGVLARDPARYNEAVECFRTAIPLDTWAWRPILDLAVLLENNLDMFGAMEYYRRCLLIHRDCLPAAESMGRLLYRNKPVPALVYIDHAIRLDEKNWIHHAYRGCILYKLSRPEEAADALSEAKALAGKGGAEANFKFAQILFPDMPNEALYHCRLATEEDPQKSQYLVLLGDIHTALWDEDSALEAYKQAVTASPQDHAAKHRYSRILHNRANPECLPMIEGAISAAPKQADYHILKANILETQNQDFPGALKAVEAAAALEPDRVDIRERLVELLKKNRKLLQFPIEKMKLEKARRKWAETLAAADAIVELTFEEDIGDQQPKTEVKK